jgi:hypothetical protein
MDDPVRPPAPHGASPEGPVGALGEPFGLVASGEWQKVVFDTVRKYPVPCLVGAAAVGFLVGRYRGRAIAGALAGAVTNVVLRQIGESFVGGDA